MVKIAKLLVFGIITALFVSACNPLSILQEQDGTPTPAATLQLPNTGQSPAVTAQDQETDGNTVVVAEVVSAGPGWLVIHAQANNTVGDVVGFSPVNDGSNKNVTIPLDPTKVTPVMYAMLHVDSGQVGKYEFPGADVPVIINGQMVNPSFAATLHGSSTTITPLVKIADQQVVGGKVTLSEVVSSGPGWIAIHVQGTDGQPGTDIGYTAVKSGSNTNVVVTVDQNQVTPVLYAMLHKDEGEVGIYEFPGADSPQEVNGQIVAPGFSTTGQPLAAVAPANTEAVQPTMDMSTMHPTQASTPTIAEQAAPTVAGTPAANPQPTQPASAPTTPPSTTVPSIKVADQAIKDGTITLPEVVSVGRAWLVIHRVNGDGTMGSMVGYTAVKDGNNLNVVVPVDTTRTSNPLAAMLHEDKGTVGSLEFPGADIPVTVNGEVITPTFNITNLASADVVINLSGGDPSTMHLVNGNGFTLYFSLQDRPGKSNCTGDCLNLWRPIVATGKIVTGSGIPAGKLGVIILEDGTRQVSYAGAPLYTYVKDIQPGQINGNGLDGTWFMVTP